MKCLPHSRFFLHLFFTTKKQSPYFDFGRHFLRQIMKQVGDDFFESKVPKVRFGRRAPNDHRAFKRFFLCSAGRNDYAVRVPNIGMCLCVMRLTILLSLRAMELSRCGVVAQLVEHHNGIVGVVSSNLIGSTRGRCSFASMCRSGEIGRHA